MRVLHLVSGLMLGGGQQVALSLAEGLGRRAGIAAEVGLLGCTEERLRDATAFVIDYDGNYASPVSLALAAAQLRAALRRRHFDLVHSHGWDADIVARWALADRPEPQLVHLHVTPGWIHSGALKHRVRRAMTRRLFAAPSVGMAAVADAVRAHWAGVFPKTAGKMRVLHNGVDVDRFRPLAEPQSRRADMQPVIIGTACRLAPQKGLPTLIEALPRVIAAAGRPLRLDIAGEGPLRGELEAKIGALGLKRHVRLLGRLQDMPRFYRSLDLFVLPAVSDEGLPLAVLEAMACGVPVVATNVGGTREAVRDPVDGRVVEPRCPETLAAALIDLISDEERRRSMGAEACRRARQAFALNLQVDRIASLYRELAGGEFRTGESVAA